MSYLHRFLFEGLPVRGALVRLERDWAQVLARRAANPEAGEWPTAVSELLGQMAAAGVLMHSNIKFNGALVLQIFGDGPLKVAVVEVQPDLSFRATAKVVGEVAAQASLSTMANVNNRGRCAITLDPKDRQPGQQPYQGVVPLHGDQLEKLESMGDVLGHYMLQSEQLDTTLVLAANGQVAAGLLIQRIPLQGDANLSGQSAASVNEDQIGRNEDYNRIAILAQSLTAKELLELDAKDILHRLFWEEQIRLFDPSYPRFSCSCSRQRVSTMLKGLGIEEVESVLAERGEVGVGCEFCGEYFRFDPVDAAQIFAQGTNPPGTDSVH